MRRLLYILFLGIVSNVTVAQNELEIVKESLLSNSNYNIVRSYSSFHKASKETDYGTKYSTYMHFKNDSIIYTNHIDSSFMLSTNSYFYSVNDADSTVNFRVNDSSYIFGWNYSILFNVIKEELDYVTNSSDTITFYLNENLDDLSMVKYYGNDTLHIDIYLNIQHYITIYYLAHIPTKRGIPIEVEERMRKITFVNDSLVFSNACRGYSIQSYNMNDWNSIPKSNVIK